ncbi:MAG: hypothetical protein Q8891_05080 [Bacteroidota bacterium]|nr:hypothetical protein [Bacteroidota bacterium]
MRSSFIHIYLVLILGVFFISPFTGELIYGQSENLNKIQSSYANNYSGHLKEKIYVHTDRSFFLCGEILWFKVYLTNALTNQPLSVSKVVYVDILNKLGQPVLQGKIAMKNGVGNGSFYLPYSVESGNYVFRAYTNLMKGFSPDNYFEKNVSIINTSKNLDSTAIHKSVSYVADFFPEGGNLVNGLESTIAFKVTDDKNKGVDGEGVVVDQSKDTVAHFKSFQFGMGEFSFKPEVGKYYTAIINIGNGTPLTKLLPEAYNSGYAMHVADAGVADLEISVSATGIQQNNSPFIYMIIQNNGQIDLAKALRMDNGKSFFVLDKDSLKEGVSQITLFDANKQPLCERLYFKRPQSKLLIKVKTDKENYQSRSKVVMDVSTTNQSGIPLSGNLSAAVYRLDSLHQADPENIFSYLWLSSNLHGAIENPAYYFKNDNGTTNEALDLLMLTQGWRKFNSENNGRQKMPAFAYVPEFAGHIITGKVTDTITKMPAPGVLVYFSVPGKRVQLRGCISDSNGLVHFEMKDFYGANQIVMQTNSERDSIYHLEIFSPFSEKISDRPVPAFHFSEKNRDDLLSANMHMEIENTYHEDQLQELVTPVVDTVPFYFEPYKTYRLDDYTRFTTMEEVVREYVTEVNVRKNGSQFRLMTVNEPGFLLKDKQPTVVMFDNNPLVLLDGVPVFNINKIMAYDPLKVQKLEVVSEKYHYGPIDAEGILSFTTYKGNLENYTLDPQDVVLDYEGLQQQRIFYSPEYATSDERSSRLPDFRDLLYWTPTLDTDLNGKGKFSFYTGDVPGQYVVVVQGFAPGGCAGSYSFTFNVSR